MWKRLITLSLVFGLAAAGPPALAQTTCIDHDHLAKTLAAKHGEEVVGRGLQSATQLFEVWRSSDTGSWTIVMLRPDGIACIMASGFAWTTPEPKLLGTQS